MKKLLVAVAALCLAASGSAALAENPLAKESATLRLGGLDLSTVDGQQRLAIRLDQAAATVCGDRLASVHLALAEQSRACRAQVVAEIRGKIEQRYAAAGLSQVKIASAK